MTTKDYKVIAAAIKKSLPPGEHPAERYTQWLRVIDCMCEALKKDNSRFKEIKFREACGMD